LDASSIYGETAEIAQLLRVGESVPCCSMVAPPPHQYADALHCQNCSAFAVML
jgi:hypothetical protein